MENIVQRFDTTLNTVLQDYIKKPTIIRGVVHLLLMLYLARIAPVPPVAVLRLFDNVYFKLFVFSLVLWTAQFSPSTSILIALAFMVTINYSTTGKVWEMLENTNVGSVRMDLPVTKDQSIDAVKILGNTSISPLATSSSIILPIANVALVSTTTPNGVAAIQTLAQQSMVAESGTRANITSAVSDAVNSILTKQVSEPSPQMNPMDAIKALSIVASSPDAMSAEKILPVATVAMSVMTTREGVDAVKVLAQQAIVAEAGDKEKVLAATKVAMDSMPTPAQAILILKAAADSPTAVSSEKILPVATIAMSGVTTPEGVAAVKVLTQQAIVPESGNVNTLDVASKVALDSVPKAQHMESGCYPLRNYDMSKVQGQEDGRFTFEDYQTFSSTPQ